DGAGRVAVACDCGMEERASRVMLRARIPKRYEHCDFESYSTEVGATPQHAVAALKELIRRGHHCLFCDYRELLKEIQASYNPASESTEMSILDPVRTAEVLVLDDLGASKPSAWVLDIIGLVLNGRYNERRVTILTTNYFDEAESAAE